MTDVWASVRASVPASVPASVRALFGASVGSSVGSSVRATAAEKLTPRPGDDLVDPADVVMDRAFTLPGAPPDVWPWLEQLGRARAGWYLPRLVERFLPRGHRALRRIDPRWLGLRVGDVVPDYGGRNATFQIAATAAPTTLVYRSRRGRTEVSWSIVLAPVAGAPVPQTRVALRLRLGPVRHRWLARTVGEAMDLFTVAGMAVGLRERLADVS